MNGWKQGFTTETPKQVFKVTYIGCAALGIFALLSCWKVHFYSSEHTKKKWLGGILGVLENAAVLTLVYVFCNIADILALGIIIFVMHVVHLFLVGFLWKPDKNV